MPKSTCRNPVTLTGGRPKADSEKIEQACILYQNSDKTAAEVCKMVGIGKRTLFKYLAKQKKLKLV